MIIKGIDTLEFGLDVEDYNNAFSDFLTKLNELKLSAQGSFKEEIIFLNGINLIVKPKGQGLYSYKLECDDFHICFMNKQVANTSPIFVRFISQFIWRFGHVEAYIRFLEWFKVFNLKITSNKISRLDPCLDTDEVDFVEEDREKFVTRARKVEKYYPPENLHYENKGFSGFVVGKGSILSLRIYDKSLQVKLSDKKWFHDIWYANGWNGESKVWRTEFQIRRKVLKELGILTVEDMFSKLDNVWAYLTQEWITIRNKTDSNISRCEVDKKWQIIQKAGNDYISVPTIRVKIRKGDLERLLRQWKGLTSSISAVAYLNNMRDTYLFIMQKLKELYEFNNTSYEKEVEKKRNRFIM